MSDAVNVGHPEDVHDERKHACGCWTYFDVPTWRSVVIMRCTEHARIESGRRAGLLTV